MRVNFFIGNGSVRDHKFLWICEFSDGFSLRVKSSKAESFMNTFLFGWVFTQSEIIQDRKIYEYVSFRVGFHLVKSSRTESFMNVSFRVGFHLEWNHPRPKDLWIRFFSGGFSLSEIVQGRKIYEYVSFRVGFHLEWNHPRPKAFMNTFLFGWVFT